MRTHRWSYTWYYVVPVLSLGLLAFIPFLHAATRLRTVSSRIKTAVFAAGAVAAMVLSTASDTNDTPGAIAGLLIIAMTVTAPILAHGVRRQMLGVPDAAVEERRRRDAARTLTRRDPVMARELDIGIPATPGRAKPYDDGGLIDLNAATADQIATVCRVGNAAAVRVTQARDQLGGRFSTIDEVGVYAELSEADTAQVAEHGVLLR
jgi:hypothetical protein